MNDGGSLFRGNSQPDEMSTSFHFDDSFFAARGGLMMSVVWGNPNKGASLILQKYPAGMESGWHWHTAAYQGVVIQGKFTHTFKGAAP